MRHRAELENIPPAFRQSLTIPLASLVVLKPDERPHIEEIKNGILFVVAAWAATSIHSFHALNSILERLTLPRDFRLYLLDTEGEGVIRLVEELGSVFGGDGETLWIQDGKIRHMIAKYNQRDSRMMADVEQYCRELCGQLASPAPVPPVAPERQAPNLRPSSRVSGRKRRVVVVEYKAAFDAVVHDPRYQRNLDWGRPRSGHPEGTVRAHIEELERNLEAIRGRLSEVDFWRIKLLIHTHDTFKAEAKGGVAITNTQSHASLARGFLAEYCDDPDLLAIVQHHDEPYALWRQFSSKGQFNVERFASLLRTINDWNLFLAFLIVDGCTAGKSREPLRWLFREI
jgi:hypothetical protein